MDSRERMRIARRFSEKLLKKHRKFIMSVVLVGSSARKDFGIESDIDLLILIDDTHPDFKPEVQKKIEEDIARISMSIPDTQKEVVNPVTGERVKTTVIDASQIFLLTEFWDYARTGNPLINIYLRDGIPIYDVGVFRALKGLQEKGKIRVTREATEKQLKHAFERLNRAKVANLFVVASDCYGAMTTSALAVLAFMGRTPVPPSKLSAEVKTSLVDTGMLDEKYMRWLGEIFELRKKVERREISYLDGKTVDMWLERAEEFLNEMLRLLERLENKKSELVILRAVQTFYFALISSLLRVSPESVPDEFKKLGDMQNPKELLSNLETLRLFRDKLMTAFIRFFVKPGYLDPAYLNVWDEVDAMLELLKRKETGRITLSKAETLREAVRLFVQDLSKVFERENF